MSIAAGPESVILSSTAGLEIRSKDGTLMDAALSESLFGPVRHPQAGLGDLVVIFDHFSRRYLIVVMDRIWGQDGCAAAPGVNSCLSHLLLAVSKTSNPGSLRPVEWHRYSLDTTHDIIDGESSWNSNWNDVPQLAATQDAVVIAVQQIPIFGDPYTDIRPFKVRVIEKEPLLRGEFPSTWSDYPSPIDGPSFGWLVPAVQADDTGVLFFAASWTPGTCDFFVWGLEGRVPDRRLRPSTFASSSRSCPEPPAGAPQPGTDVLLDATGSTRPTLFAMYNEGSLWVTRTTAHDFGSGLVTAVHWAEIDVQAWPNNVRIVQEGIIEADEVFTFHPSIGVDKGGNAILVFHRTGQNEFPSIYYTGRAASDPLGEMRPPRLLHAGTASMPHSGQRFTRNGVQLNRFVDHAGIAYDEENNDLWIFGQYVEADKWYTTWVGRIGWSD